MLGYWGGNVRGTPTSSPYETALFTSTDEPPNLYASYDQHNSKHDTGALLDRNPPQIRGELGWQRWAWAAAFCATYVTLDWASYIDPLHRLNITPWNPAPALGLLYLLRGGAGGAITLFVALLMGDLLVRDLAASIPEVVLIDALLTMGYVGIGSMLKRHVPEGGMFFDRASLVRWVAIVVPGSLANSLVFVSGLAAFGLMPTGEWSNAVLRFWVGDGVGIFVTLPLLWWLQDVQRRLVFQTVVIRWETAGYSLLALASLWLVFMPSDPVQNRYVYVLFLPLVWAASRQGLLGAVFCASFLQLGMLLAGWVWGSHGITIFELQMRSFLLAGVGFLIGVAVDEQRRAASELRQTLRLAAAGEMAAAIAHELNQPLTALTAYGSASEQIMQRDGGSEQLREVISRMVSEAGRAAEVVRRLRDFFRTGTTHLECIPLTELMETVLQPFRDKAPSLGVELSTSIVPGLVLHADRLQIEVVLRNLLANAFDAVAAIPEGERHITLSSTLIGGDQLHLRIEDTGPGLTAALSDAAFEPFVSTKSSGLGLGLAISRAIAEAHGGTLVGEAGGHGCFILSLPIDPMRESIETSVIHDITTG